MTPADLAAACREAQETLGDLVQRAMFGDEGTREEAARVLAEVQRAVRDANVNNENVSALDGVSQNDTFDAREHVIPRGCKRRKRGTRSA